jgi:hypothetical protein
MPGWNGRELAREAGRVRPRNTGSPLKAVWMRGRPTAETGDSGTIDHARGRGARSQNLSEVRVLPNSSG